MKQLTPLTDLESDAPERQVPPPGVINIATVPHRSPFRYPGGKTWLVPRIRQWLGKKPARPSEIIEPFAGGAIVSLSAVFEDLVQRAVLVELDADIASVWQTILNGRGCDLAQRITEFQLTPASVRATLTSTAETLEDRAFATILKNRVNRGGILAPGAGMVKNGENGRGLASRWYPETLRRRILDLVEVKDRIQVICGDGIAVLQDKSAQPDAVFFIDPPYTVAGRRLYAHSEIDHAALFRAAARLQGDFLMTYDESDEVRLLADQHGLPRCAFSSPQAHGFAVRQQSDS